MRDRPRSRGYKWILLATLTSANAATLGVLFATPAVAPFLQVDLGATRTEIGFLMSANLIGGVITAIPGGWLADKNIRWNLLCFQGLIVGSVIFFSRAATLESALVACFMVGVGTGGVLPSMTKAVTNWFSSRERATAMGLFFSGASVGSAASAAILPSLSLGVGWRQVLLFMAIVILAVGVGSSVLYRDNRELARPGPTTATGARPREGKAKSIYWNLTRLGLVAILLGGPQYAMATYLLLYLKQALLFSVVQAGLFLAVAQGCGLLGRIGSGILSDRLFNGSRRLVFLAMGVVFTVCLSLIAAGVSQETALLVLMVVIGLSGFGWFSIWMTWLAEISASGSAAALGYGQTCAYVGVIIGPPLFGYMVDATNSYLPAWTVSSVVVGIGTLLILSVREPRKTSHATG
ncbi:MAG: MFS transporter [Dehalococcoidia bacterium]|nr:MFS transporter [Dehalococcoidia bacterium]